jgi:hypothetical protein
VFITTIAYVELQGSVKGSRLDRGKHILIFDPVTGKSGGKRKRTVVTMTYARPTYISH